MRVTPVAPQPVTNPDVPSLGRSGLSARDLLSAPDQIVVRSKTPGLALGMGLEQARGALIRNQPTEALMTLDEVWEGARTTETGWYLRGGSLALLGLPAEASRIASQILNKRPDSIANRFLLSLTKLTLGDLSGARMALTEAATRRPGDALLIVQEALLLARLGNRADAEQLLLNASTSFPDHPAIAYGRSLMRQALRDGARVFDEALNGLFIPSRTPRGSRALSSIDVPDAAAAQSELGALESGDVVNDALFRIGTRIALMTEEQLVAECRSLLIGLSAGGSLASAVSPSRALAARNVISAIIDALHNAESVHGQGWEAQSVDGQWQSTLRAPRNDEVMSNAFRGTVRELVNAMRDGRTNDVETILRRLDAAVDESRRGLLRGFAGRARELFTPTSVRSIDPELTLLPALRLGLGLLPPDEAIIANRFGENRIVSGVSYAVDPARAWGASGSMPVRTRGDEGGTISLFGAVALLCAAVLAFAASHAVVGFVAVAVAGWLALRQGATQRNARRMRGGESNGGDSFGDEFNHKDS